MKENASDRLKNFLVNGIGTSPRQDDEAPGEQVSETESDPLFDDPAPAEAPAAVMPAETPAPATVDPGRIEEELSGIRRSLEDLAAVRGMLEELSSREPPKAQDLTPYLTTREQSKAISATVASLEASASNKVLVAALEQICAMREDFFKLCSGMRPRIEEMDAKTVLSSFEAYEVDMENILTDSGVFIGHFDFPRINTLHQRIVGVVPTGDKEKDGTIAERFSEGYKLADRVLVKERVSVYKFDPALAAETPEAAPEGDAEGEEAPAPADADETPSETTETPSETPAQSADSEEADGMEVNE